MLSLYLKLPLFHLGVVPHAVLLLSFTFLLLTHITHAANSQVSGSFSHIEISPCSVLCKTRIVLYWRLNQDGAGPVTYGLVPFQPSLPQWRNVLMGKPPVLHFAFPTGSKQQKHVIWWNCHKLQAIFQPNLQLLLLDLYFLCLQAYYTATSHLCSWYTDFFWRGYSFRRTLGCHFYATVS